MSIFEFTLPFSSLRELRATLISRVRIMMSAGARGSGLSLMLCLSILSLSVLQDFTWSETNVDAIPDHISPFMLNENISPLENVSYYFITLEESIETQKNCNLEILEEFKPWNTNVFEIGRGPKVRLQDSEVLEFFKHAGRLLVLIIEIMMLILSIVVSCTVSSISPWVTEALQLFISTGRLMFIILDILRLILTIVVSCCVSSIPSWIWILLLLHVLRKIWIHPSDAYTTTEAGWKKSRLDQYPLWILRRYKTEKKRKYRYRRYLWSLKENDGSKSAKKTPCENLKLERKAEKHHRRYLRQYVLMIRRQWEQTESAEDAYLDASDHALEDDVHNLGTAPSSAEYHDAIEPEINDSSMQELSEPLSKPISASESSSREHLSERLSKQIDASEYRSRALSSEPGQQPPPKYVPYDDYNSSEYPSEQSINSAPAESDPLVVWAQSWFDCCNTDSEQEFIDILRAQRREYPSESGSKTTPSEFGSKEESSERGSAVPRTLTSLYSRLSLKFDRLHQSINRGTDCLNTLKVSDTKSEDTSSEDDEDVEYAYMMTSIPELSYDTKRAPTWSGDVESYNQYKRTVRLWEAQAEHLSGDKPDHTKTGPMLARGLLGGQAKAWLERADLDQLCSANGKKYMFDSLDRIYLRDNFERIFTNLLELFTYTKSESDKTKPKDANEWEHFVSQYILRIQRFQDVSGAGVKIPEYILAMLCIYLMQLTNTQRGTLFREMDPSVKQEGTKLTMPEVQRVVRQVLAPDPELQRIRGRTGQQHKSALLADEEHDSDAAEEEQETYLARRPRFQAREARNEKTARNDRPARFNNSAGPSPSKPKGKGKGGQWFKNRSSGKYSFVCDDGTVLDEASEDEHEQGEEEQTHDDNDEEEGTFFAKKKKLPEGSAPKKTGRHPGEGNFKEGRKNANGMRCYDCQSEYHLVGSKFCKKKSGYYAEEEKSNFAAAFMTFPERDANQQKEKKQRQAEFTSWITKGEEGNQWRQSASRLSHSGKNGDVVWKKGERQPGSDQVEQNEKVVNIDRKFNNLCSTVDGQNPRERTGRVKDPIDLATHGHVGLFVCYESQKWACHCCKQFGTFRPYDADEASSSSDTTSSELTAPNERRATRAPQQLPAEPPPKRSRGQGAYTVATAFLAKLLRPGEVLCDIGCSMSMIGRPEADTFCREAKVVTGLEYESRPSDVKYKTAGGKTTANEARTVPVSIGGQSSSTDFQVVPHSTPGLLGHPALKNLMCDISLRPDKPPVIFSHLFNKFLEAREVGGLIAINLLEKGKNMKETAFDPQVIEEMSSYFSMTRDQLMRFHKSLGHINAQKMIALLRKAGTDADQVDEETIKRAEKIPKECTSCNITAPEPGKATAGGVTAYRRGERYVCDIIYPRDKQRKYSVLHVIDVFSRFQRAYILYDQQNQPITDDTPSAEKLQAVQNALRRVRLEMGLPSSLLIDGDGMLNNDIVKSYLQLHGTKCELSGPHSPWQNGLCERHGGLLKLLISRFFSDDDDEDLGPPSSASFPAVLDVLISRKNEAPGAAEVEGVSPYEAFFGRRPQSHQMNEGYALERSIPADFLTELQELRLIHTRLENVINSGRTRKLIEECLAKVIKPTTKHFNVGDKVWFFTKDSGKVKSNTPKWKGPAIVTTIKDRIATVDFHNIFYKRSVDMLKIFHEQHQDVGPAAAPPAAHLANAFAVSSKRHDKKSIAYVAFSELLKGKFMAEETRAQIAAVYGLPFHTAQMKRDQFCTQTLRGVASQRIALRVTVGYTRGGRMLYFYEDAGPIYGAARHQSILSPDYSHQTYQVTFWFLHKEGQHGTLGGSQPVDQEESDDEPPTENPIPQGFDEEPVLPVDEDGLDESVDPGQGEADVNANEVNAGPAEFDLAPGEADSPRSIYDDYEFEWHDNDIWASAESPQRSSPAASPQRSDPPTPSTVPADDTTQRAPDPAQPAQPHTDFAPTFGPARAPPPTSMETLQREADKLPYHTLRSGKSWANASFAQTQDRFDEMQDDFVDCDESAFYAFHDCMEFPVSDNAFLTMRELKPKEVPKNLAVGDEWNKARHKELESFKHNRVYIRRRRQDLPHGVRPVPTRWVYTRKDDGSAKARLTGRGDLETRRNVKEGLDPLPTDSPTVSRVGLRMFLAISCQAGWDLMNFDVPTAFLRQDEEYMDSRRQPLWIVPPEDCRASEDEVWECTKIPYGFSDAPRAWYFTFCKWVKENAHAKQVVGDSCIYTFFDKAGNLRGQLALHVDDGMVSGTAEFLREIKQLLQKRWEIQNFQLNDFKFCGLWIRKVGTCIYVDQEKYAEMVSEIPLTRQRAAQTDDKMTAQEIKAVQSVAGAGNWVATQTRPDLSFDVSELVGLVSHDGTVACIKKANKLVKRLKAAKSAKLVFRPLRDTSLQDLRLRAYSDASWANCPGLKSQSGQVFALVGSRDGEHTTQGNLVHWRSQRIQRVCRSTFAAETLSATDTVDQAIFLSDMLSCWIHGTTAAPKPAVDVFVDCHSLVDAIQQIEPACTEKRLKLDLLALKENLESGAINSLRWLDTHIQVADPLTKHMDTTKMMQTFASGTFPHVLAESEAPPRSIEKLSDNQRTLLAFCMHRLLPDVYG